MGIALNLYIALGHVDILTMLVVPVREHGRYFHFIVSFQTLICKDKCIPKFTAAFMVAKTWKQPKCPLTDDLIKKMWYTYTMEYYSAIRKDEILTFVTTWISLENTMLS